MFHDFGEVYVCQVGCDLRTWYAERIGYITKKNDHFAFATRILNTGHS